MAAKTKTPARGQTFLSWIHVRQHRELARRGHAYSAADHAHQSAGTLARTAVGSGMFGNFTEAKAFGRKVIDAQSHNLGLIKHHTQQLGKIGDHARCTAGEFEDMERRNEAQIRAVRDAR